MDHRMAYSSVQGAHAWKPGAWQRFPWLGFLRISGALVGIAASIAILVVSDGALISDWKYAPTVYLSISYTISNILLAAAFSEGVTLSWWNKATKDDTVLGDLHRYHTQGRGAWAALTAGRHFNFIAFAALFVTITPINGPLLQRSSRVGVKSIASQSNLRLPIVRALWDSTGFISGRAFVVPLFSGPFNDVVQAYSRGDTVVINGTGCPGDGTCSGRLIGAGLAVDCSTASADFDVTQTSGTYPNGSSIINWNSVNGTDVFQSSFYWSSGLPGNISLNVQYKDAAAIEGQLVVKNCTMQTAAVQYPIVIDGNSSTISLSPSTSVFDDVIIEMNSYPVLQSFGHNTEIGGYAFALSNRFNAWTHLRWVGAAGYELRSQGPIGPQFASMEDVEDYFDGISHVKFDDPTPYLLQQARELMFRTALAQGNSTTMEVAQGASQVRTAGVYGSHYDFLGAAVAISLIAVCIVIATYNGYWHLGRTVSMSPVEIAKAFNAPLLRQQDSNATADEIAKSAGSMLVQYGLISEKASRGGLGYQGFAQNMSADQDENRFEIADPAQVTSLRR